MAGRVISSFTAATIAVVQKEPTSAAESRIRFRLPYGTSGTRALPDLDFGWRFRAAVDFVWGLRRDWKLRPFQTNLSGWNVAPGPGCDPARRCAVRGRAARSSPVLS